MLQPTKIALKSQARLAAPYLGAIATDTRGLGAAFPHQSGDGFNVILQALPLPSGDGTCKIVLRPPKDDRNDKSDKDAEDERTRQAVRQSNDRRHGRTR
jgi:hypothetical protein